MSGGGQRSPPRGGFDITASNQQLLVDEPDEEVLIPSASGTDHSFVTLLHILYIHKVMKRVAASAIIQGHV